MMSLKQSPFKTIPFQDNEAFICEFEYQDGPFEKIVGTFIVASRIPSPGGKGG
jgi:hypothetical protein